MRENDNGELNIDHQFEMNKQELKQLTKKTRKDNQVKSNDSP